MAKNYFYGTTDLGERKKINVAYVTDANGNRKKLLKLYATDSAGKASLVYENVHTHNWSFLIVDGWDNTYHYNTYFCTECNERESRPEAHSINFMACSSANNADYHYKDYACAYCGYGYTVNESHNFSTTYEQAPGYPGAHYKVSACDSCGYEDRSLESCTYNIPDTGGLTGELLFGYYCICGDYQAV